MIPEYMVGEIRKEALDDYERTRYERHVFRIYR